MFGHTPKIYSTYLMFGWSFHVFTVPKAYFLEEQTDFIFTLHLKVQDQKDWQTECFPSTYKNISAASCFELKKMCMAKTH